MFLKTITLLALSAFTASAGFVNGDFSTGDLTGWSHYLTTNGADPAGNVLAFDTTGSGASDAAHFHPGQVIFGGPNGGAGISQSLSLLAGVYTVTADIASTTGTLDNGSGGLFSLFVDGDLVDSYDFGFIDSFTTLRSSRSATFTFASDATHTFEFQFVRPYIQVATTPDVYIDNIVLSSQTGPEAPEPASAVIFGLGFAGMLAVRMKKRNQA